MTIFDVGRCVASESPDAGSVYKIPTQRRRIASALSPTWSLATVLVLAVCAAPCLAGTVRQLTDLKSTTIGAGFPSTSLSTSGAASLDDAGTAVYVNASTNQLGGNPDHRFQIFRFDAAMGAGQQITNFSKGVSNKPLTVSVSDDGQWIAFVSRADPVGQNHDASPEAFVMHPDGSGIAQVTNDPSVTAAGVTAAVLSGSANRVVFRSSANPLGTNPSNRVQLFVINVDGTGLKQLTSATTSTSYWGISISDDGQRIVFASTANLTGGNADEGTEVFAMQADGTNLRQITSSPDTGSATPVISGNGSKIAYESNRQIYALNWDGTGLLLLTPSTPNAISPSITDDGQLVFFSAYAAATTRYEIWKVRTDATGLTQLTSSVGGMDLNASVVAGGGSRVAFAGTISSTTAGYALSGELGVMSANGTNRLQLMTTTAWDIIAPTMTRDGTRIVFSSTMNPFGTNPDGGYEIFRIQADGTGLFQVTNIPSASAFTADPTIRADGNVIVFSSDADIDGQNPYHNYDTFRINADGTGVQRITYSSGAYQPQISANGSVVVFGVTTGGGAINVGMVTADGSWQQTLTGDGGSWKASVDDTGTWISFQGLYGSPGNRVNQVWRIRTDGNGLERLTTDATRHHWYPEISGTGTRIVYYTDADPVGSNPNHYLQLFTYDTTTSQTWQVTAGTTPGGAASAASISGDANWAVWLASEPWDEPNPNGYLNLYRVPATGGPAQRIGAGPTSVYGGTGTGFVLTRKPRTDMTGTRTVFPGTDDPTGQNPDYSSDLWMVDLAREPEIRVSRTAPTLVSWDWEAGAVRYDVIRGDVANLAPGLPGTVDLGAVVCLENDSPDASILGFEDAATPLPGHAFFFLFRGSHGLNFGPGSWGQASEGLERVPGSGVCAP